MRDVGPRRATDKEIWLWAKAICLSIVTSDADFVAMSQDYGPPPKVIHIEQCDFPLSVIEDLLRRSANLITEFEKSESSGLLTLRVGTGQESQR